MYEEILKMSREELAFLLALIQGASTEDEFKVKVEKLKERYTPTGLRLMLWEWLTGEKNIPLEKYKEKEAEIIEKIADEWNAEKKLSLKETEMNIAEKVLLEIVHHLSPEEREKLAEELKKAKIDEEDKEKLMQKLKEKIPSLSPKDLLALITLLTIKKYPFPLPPFPRPIPLLPFPPSPLEIIIRYFQRKKMREKLIKGLIILMCVIKRLSEEKKE